LKRLLQLQGLHLQIETLKAQERDTPKQKSKFDLYRKRLAAELEEREEVCRALVLEQRERESEIDQIQAQIQKYEQQLYAVKKNDAYQALLHEIDMAKKQVGLKEERTLAIMMELDEAQAGIEEDKKRIDAEFREIDEQVMGIDQELAEALAERKILEQQCGPLEGAIAPDLIAQYSRVRTNKKTGPVVVPLNDEVCSGCNMALPAQVVNEVLAGEKTHACIHCGRILYYKENVEDAAVESP